MKRNFPKVKSVGDAGSLWKRRERREPTRIVGDEMVVAR
jgi:hypothetical protein